MSLINYRGETPSDSAGYCWRPAIAAQLPVVLRFRFLNARPSAGAQQLWTRAGFQEYMLVPPIKVETLGFREATATFLGSNVSLSEDARRRVAFIIVCWVQNDGADTNFYTTRVPVDPPARTVRTATPQPSRGAAASLPVATPVAPPRGLPAPLSVATPGGPPPAAPRRFDAIRRVEYVGAIPLVAAFTPTRPCEEYLLDLQALLPEVPLPYIVDECTRIAEDRVNRIAASGRPVLRLDHAFAVAVYTYDLGMAAPECNNFFVQFNAMLIERNPAKMRIAVGYLSFLLSALNQLPLYRGMA